METACDLTGYIK